MRKLKTIDENEYSKRLAVQFENGNGFAVHQKGSRKELFVHNRLVATHTPNGFLDLGELSNQKFASFLGNFQKHLNRKLINSPGLIDLKINFNGVARYRNSKVWEQIPVGAIFYNIDLNSAYWQMAHRLGYIDNEFFKTYLDIPEYKSAKRFCISFLARTNKKTYYNPDGTFYEIHCDTTPLQMVYTNIRKELYKVINGAINGIDDFLEYNVDGVVVLPKDALMVRNYFREQGLKYKNIFCQKINENQYTHGKKIKNFGKPRKSLENWNK
jgi:hypothetical protein